MASGNVAANPGAAAAGGQNVEALAAGFGQLGQQLAGAAQAAGAAAGESEVQAAYPNFESLQVNKINAVMHHAGAMGQNIQSGAAEFVGTDGQNASDFGSAGALLPPINAGSSRAV